MEVHHPSDDGPLSAEQVLLLEQFRHRVEARISSHGLTSDDVAALVKELRDHPQMSRQLMAELAQELQRLLPGQRFSFDWD
ncbi:hypothetical protein L107_02699 [Cyanobium sp. Copco_Reservoir_LC18]|uniref:hypothetical protein n=1 Tax=Cyanobium sp. Copco_Reservoir_LC18 TaxID=1328305 RepID=UPI001356AC46|nr:hypothetical protein [Cyanobium sp. Copco_Reservoir_LC18]KAF0654580.1 hypothetical protein L107_02699 [Cyanobium sp. Copco_Reservoir_LC18]